MKSTQNHQDPIIHPTCDAVTDRRGGDRCNETVDLPSGADGGGGVDDGRVKWRRARKPSLRETTVVPDNDCLM